MLLSAGLQIVIFPLPNLYFLGWIALAPLLVALLRAREPETLQLSEGAKLVPASPGRHFFWLMCPELFGMRGRAIGFIAPCVSSGEPAPSPACSSCFCLAPTSRSTTEYLDWRSAWRPARSAKPCGVGAGSFFWVALELARTRITGFPWDLLGITQVDNIPLARVATVTGVYGVSLEIMIVNVAFAAAFLVRRDKRNALLLAAVAAAVVLQVSKLMPSPVAPADHTALLVQENIPILDRCRLDQGLSGRDAARPVCDQS